MGIDPTLVDPRLVLAEIAGNPAQPASTRVAAAKALLAAQQKAPAQDRDDFTNIRAVEMLAAGRRLNGMAKSNRIPIVEVFSLAGADRCRTTSCWRRNAISASRAARDLNSPTSNPPSSLKRSIIPKRG
jgi:hypothetical protein